MNDDGTLDDEDIANKDIGMNLPAGEVFVAPIEESANGVAFFDVPTSYFGATAHNIKLTFKNGKVVDFTAVGQRNVRDGGPLQKDSIFRIYSMTKLVTSVAALQLVERGLLQLEHTMRMIRENLNPKVHIKGILPTLLDARTLHGREAVEVLRELVRRGAEVRVVMTEAAQRFVAPLTFATLSRQPVLADLYTLDYGREIGHVAAPGRAHLLLVAPATAHTIAKFAHGLADDFLTNIYLAAACPVLLAPAMDADMYRHPATQENLETLRRRGVRIVGPASGELASGIVGPGRLSEPAEIVAAAEALLLAGRYGEVEALVRPFATSASSLDRIHATGLLAVALAYWWFGKAA